MSEKKEWKTRKRKGQALLVPLEKKKVVSRVLSPREKAHRLEVRKLHELHKKVRAGLVKPVELTDEQKDLLKKYYGY